MQAIRQWFRFSHLGPAGSIQRGLYLLVACAILPALLIILHASLSQRQKALDEAFDDLDNLTKSAADLQSEKTLQAKLALQTLAALPQVRNLDIVRLNAIFAQFIQDNPAFANINLASPGGDLLASGVPMTKSVSIADRASFQQALRSKVFSAGDYVIGRLVHEPIFQFSLPVLGAAGQVAGVLVLDQRLSNYSQHFEPLKQVKHSRLVFLDRNSVRIMAFAWDGQLPPGGQPDPARKLGFDEPIRPGEWPLHRHPQ